MRPNTSTTRKPLLYWVALATMFAGFAAAAVL